MTERIIQSKNTFINYEYGHVHDHVDPVAVEIGFIKAFFCIIEDAESVTRRYGYRCPTSFWVCDLILEDDTRVPVACSFSGADIQRIAEHMQSVLRVNEVLPIIDRSKAGSA